MFQYIHVHTCKSLLWGRKEIKLTTYSFSTPPPLTKAPNHKQTFIQTSSFIDFLTGFVSIDYHRLKLSKSMCYNDIVLEFNEIKLCKQIIAC